MLRFIDNWQNIMYEILKYISSNFLMCKDGETDEEKRIVDMLENQV